MSNWWTDLVGGPGFTVKPEPMSEMQRAEREKWKEQNRRDLYDRTLGQEEELRDQQNYLQNRQEWWQQRESPYVDYSDYVSDRIRGNQSRDAMEAWTKDIQNQLAQSRAGNAPSVAQNQLQAGLDANMRQQQAMAAGARGGAASRAAADRQAAMAGAQMGMQTNQQAAQLRAQEQIANEQMYNAMLSDAYTQMRAQDLQAAGMSGDMAYRQAALEQQQTELNDQMTRAYMEGANQIGLGYYGGLIDQYGQWSSRVNAQEGANASRYGVDRGAESDMFGTAGSVLGAGISAVSDKRVKTEAKPAAIDAMLDSLKPYTYRYTGKYDDGKSHVGVMAQDMYKTESGRQHVVNTPRGKKTMMVTAEPESVLSAISRMNERLASLEGKNKPQEADVALRRLISRRK